MWGNLHYLIGLLVIESLLFHQFKELLEIGFMDNLAG